MIGVHHKSANTPAASADTPLLPSGVARPFVLVTGLFFLWGIPNNLNDVLIRQFMKSFAISRFQAGLVQFAFYLGYFFLALPAGLLIKRKGYKTGFLTGLALFAAGCFLFWPAAITSTYGLFLTALFVMASGLAFLETAANPFIARLGDPESAERRLNFAQAFNPLGAISGVLLGTLFIFSGIELTPAQTVALQQAGTYTAYLHRETLRVIAPYVGLGLIVTVWAIALATTRLPTPVTDAIPESGEESSWKRLFAHPALLFAVAAQLLYVSAQVGTWSYFIPYAQEYTRVSERTAGLLLTGTLGAFGLGRFSSAWIMRWFAPARLMFFYAIVNLLLLGIGIAFPGWPGLISIFLTSFFMSIMYPTIFALGLRGLGPDTNVGGSLLVMAILGGAMTPLMGLIAEHFHGTAPSYLVPVVSYAVIAIYSRFAQRTAESAA